MNPRRPGVPRRRTSKLPTPDPASLPDQRMRATRVRENFGSAPSVAAGASVSIETVAVGRDPAAAPVFAGDALSVAWHATRCVPSPVTATDPVRGREPLCPATVTAWPLSVHARPATPEGSEADTFTRTCPPWAARSRALNHPACPDGGPDGTVDTPTTGDVVSFAGGVEGGVEERWV